MAIKKYDLKKVGVKIVVIDGPGDLEEGHRIAKEEDAALWTSMEFAYFHLTSDPDDSEEEKISKFKVVNELKKKFWGHFVISKARRTEIEKRDAKRKLEASGG